MNVVLIKGTLELWNDVSLVYEWLIITGKFFNIKISIDIFGKSLKKENGRPTNNISLLEKMYYFSKNRNPKGN